MKKMSGWILAIAMVACLTGCFNNDKTNVDINTPNNIDTPNNVDVPNKDEKDDTQLSGDIKDEKVEFSMGSWNNNIYTNEFLSIRYELPQGWARGEDKEIISIMKAEEDTDIKSDEFREIAKDFRNVYYFTADNNDIGCGLSVATEKRDVTMTAEEYINELEKIMKDFDGEEYSGFVNTKETVAGEEYATLYMKIEKYGIHQKYYVRKLEDRFLTIFVSGYDVNDLENAIKAFKNA